MEIRGRYLHLALRRTNREIPYLANISSTSYPAQDQDKLNQWVDVTIKDNFKVHPGDQPPYIAKADPQVITIPCKIIRYDVEEPYVAVYVSENYEYVVTDSSKTPTEYPLINTLQYDKNDMDMIGQIGYLQTGMIYNDNILKTFDYEGVVISSSSSEPLEDVILGLYSETEYTVFLGKELWFRFEGRNIISDDSEMPAKGKTIEVRRLLMEGRVPYGISQNTVSE